MHMANGMLPVARLNYVVDYGLYVDLNRGL